VKGKREKKKKLKSRCWRGVGKKRFERREREKREKLTQMESV
jgi:hypothetical protein